MSEVRSRLQMTNYAIEDAIKAHGEGSEPVLVAILSEIARSVAIIADAARNSMREERLGP